jgi:sulfoquinovosyltransferase
MSCCVFSGLSLSQVYASSDVFVMPSDTETLGFVAMEAMASGLPVVGARAGGLLDIIDHNHTGYLCGNDDGGIEFVHFTKHLAEKSELRRQFGRAARQRALEWSWEDATMHLRNELYPLAVARHRKHCP